MRSKILKIILIILILFFAGDAFGYDNLVTHPKISESAVAIYNQRADLKITDQQRQWILKGSTNEDNDPRYLNHYYNPVTGKGLDAWDQAGGLSFKVQGRSAKLWAKNQTSQTGDYSEAAILKNYQDGNLTRAYQGVGHILHLVQDMAVPAHTRNDSHAMGDPYEKWVEKYTIINPSRLSFLNVNSLDQAFDLMANYSNNNFFSSDSVDINKKINYKIESVIDNNKKKNYYIGSISGADYKLCYTVGPDWILARCYVDDDLKLNIDYWTMLYPKAVGYSAGVIEYFVKQFEQIDKIKKEQEQANLLQKLKNSLVRMGSEAQYAWGDVYMAERNMIAGAYDFLTSLFRGSQENLQYFTDANKEIIEQAANEVTNQAKQVGQVLSAYEVGEESGQGNPVIPLNPPLQGGQDSLYQESEILDGETPPAPEENTNPSADAEALADKLNPPLEGGQNTAEGNTQGGQNNPPNPLYQGGRAPSTPIIIAGDGLAPDTFITSAPAQIININSAAFTFSSGESNSTFDCDLNDAGWQTCVSPNNFSGLTDRDYIFKVRARDSSNNFDQTPAQHSWTVDTIPPPITMVSAPPDMSSSTVANFLFASSENFVSYQCSLDAAPWQLCSASTSAADLIEGNHSLEVRGSDQAGNISSSTVKFWLVDITAPTSTMASLNATYLATGFTVSWNGMDADSTGSTTPASGLADFDAQYKIESGDWQDWVNATTSTSTVFSLPVASGQNIYFRVRARDLAGNLGEWSAETQTKIENQAADHVVISEVTARGPAGATDEFVELYNPTSQAVDLTGWKLKYKSATGADWDNRSGDSGLIASSSIASKGYYLMTSKEYSFSPVPDYRHSANFGMADGGGHIKILDGSDAEIDRVGYGSADNPEGAAFTVDFSAGQSLERKASATSTAETMAAGGSHQFLGNGYDSNDNSADFILRNIPEPQNSGSLAEPRETTPDSTAPTSTVASLNVTYLTTGFTLSWSGEDYDDTGATTTSSGITNFDLQYKIDAGGWQDWINATTSTSTIFSLAVGSGQTVYFRVRARDLSGNLENWPAEENGDAWTVVDDSPTITYDIVRDDVSELYKSSFGRDYMITDFRPATSSISGVAIKITDRDAVNFSVTLCKGTANVENAKEKINCGSDELITQKTCATASGIDAWQSCTFDKSFRIVPGNDYYVIVTGSAWLGATWSSTNYGMVLSCGFNSGVVLDQYCFNAFDNAFLTFKTYYDRTVPY